MPRFDPPTRPQSAGNRFWERFSTDVGVSVIKRGDTYVEAPAPSNDELSGIEGVDWFLGGHVYAVSEAVGEALISDGFDVDMDAGFGFGEYGDEGYGD